jgi:polyphosphate kinase
MADDASRPFPFISNNSLNIAVQLRRQIRSTSEPVAEEILEGDQEVHRPQMEPHDDRQEAGYQIRNSPGSRNL